MPSVPQASDDYPEITVTPYVVATAIARTGEALSDQVRAVLEAGGGDAIDAALRRMAGAR